MVSSESPGRERAATTLLRRFQTGAARRAEEETSSTSGASSGSSRSSSTRRANAGVVTAVRGLGDRFGAGARRRERETRKAELSDGRRRRRDDASANDGGEGGTGTGRVSASTSTFDVDATYDAARAFFSLPERTKCLYVHTQYGSESGGFVPTLEEYSYRRNTAALVESFDVVRELDVETIEEIREKRGDDAARGLGPVDWPVEVPKMRKAFKAYYAAVSYTHLTLPTILLV